MRILSILFLFYYSFGCQNPKINTEMQSFNLKDSVSIHSHSIQDTFKFSKEEFKLIIENHPEINSYPPLHPDIVYQKNNNGFYSETGQDVYYTIYAYFLEKKNHNSKQLRIKLIDAFHKVNIIHGIYKRGGSFFGHQKARIAAYAEYTSYKYRNVKPNQKNFKRLKTKYIENLQTKIKNGIIKLVNTPENVKQLLIKEINLEISQLEELIENNILLEAIQDFEQLYYNYENNDQIW
jgi:hypothetical protein